MMLLDANIFLRYLVEPTTPELRRQHDTVSNLFESLADQTTTATLTETALSEVFFVLTSPRVYGFAPADAVALMRPLIGLRGLKLANRDVAELALDLYTSYPMLGFDDCLLASHGLCNEMPVYTFDQHFDRIPGLRRIDPKVDGGELAA
jgi:predicted nucleic acid-binding protein